MDETNILMQEIEQRIAQLEKDELIDNVKKAILIRENKRFLVRCQQLFLSALNDMDCGYCKSYEKLSPYLYCPYCGKKYEGKSQSGS